jgi:hypothetical protein
MTLRNDTVALRHMRDYAAQATAISRAHSRVVNHVQSDSRDRYVTALTRSTLKCAILPPGNKTPHAAGNRRGDGSRE